MKLENLKGKKVFGGLVITKPVNFIISCGVAAVLVLTSLIWMLSFIDNDGAPEGYRRIHNKELVGYYALLYKYGNGTPVFEVTTPRGVEKCVGYENLQESLDTYRMEGIYGLPHEEVIDPSEEKESK